MLTYSRIPEVGILIAFFYLQSQRDREYMITNATKRRGGKTYAIEPPLPKMLTIIDQIQ